MPSLNSVFPFLENIRPKYDYTWHLRRGRLLDSYESVSMSCYTANGSGQTALHFVSDLEHTQNITGAKRRYLLCLVPEWGVEDVRSPLVSICSSLPRRAHGYINTRIDLKNWNRA